MRLTGSRWPAARSGRAAGLLLALLCVMAARPATRPRYGGVLRVEVRDPAEGLDPPSTGRLAEAARGFRITHWEPGRRAEFAADDGAPGGRPFLDGVAIELARPLREQALDLELGRADLVEAGAAEARRMRNKWTSAPVRLVVLVCGPRLQDARVREALARAVDRGAIHTVLLQRQGEISGGLLPQWLSGYAFLFDVAQDSARARALVESLPAPQRAFSLGYDAGEPQARAVAERIALNARDTGLLVSVAPSATADVRLLQLRIEARTPADALVQMAGALHLGEVPRGAGVESLYQIEKTLLEGFRVIPLFHLPDVYGVGPRVRTWLEPGVGKLGEWRLDGLWLEGGKP